jgi:tRNA threonylcarbamoyladenosine modification (KEOPS) complex  Pcc1 subunit
VTHSDEVGETRDARTHDETIRFGLDGIEYAMNVDAADAERFRAEIEPYLRASRPVRARRAG